MILLPTLAAGAVVAGAAVAAAGSMATRHPRSALFSPNIWRGHPGRKSIALTFDDGPSESTPELLRVLEQYNVPATFFQVGYHARRLPEIARQAAQGHEIGNHTDTHPALWLKSRSFIQDEVNKAQETLGAYARVTWFRAPFGVRWFGLRGALRKHQLTNVMWGVIGRDWTGLSGAAIAGLVLAQPARGLIVCLHDGRSLTARPNIANTVEAVRRLIPQLLEQGCQFETVSEVVRPQASQR